MTPNINAITQIDMTKSSASAAQSCLKLLIAESPIHGNLVSGGIV